MSPRPSGLERLRPAWEEVGRAAGLDPAVSEPPTPPVPRGLEWFGVSSVEQLAQQPFKADTAEANGSSIAVLADHDGKAALLSADAFPEVILQPVDRHLAEAPHRERLHVDALKLPHHGSRANLHLPLLRRIQSSRHLISADGTQTRHPNPGAIARVVVTQDAPQFVFNYRTAFTEAWDPDTTSVPSNGHG